MHASVARLLLVDSSSILFRSGLRPMMPLRGRHFSGILCNAQVDNMFIPNMWDAFCSAISPNITVCALLLVPLTNPIGFRV